MANTNILRPLILALSLAVTAPLAVHAQAGSDVQDGAQKEFRHKGFGEHRRGDFTQNLNLTETQRDKVSELRQAVEPALREKSKEVRAARHEMHQLSMSETFDESRAVALSTQAARAEAELNVMRLRLNNQIFNVLTPEQRKQAAEARQQRIERAKALAPTARPAQQVQ